MAACRRDLEAMQQLASDSAVDLFGRIPHGDNQTYLREVLLARDHASYHVGQLVLVRRLLGNWPAA